MSAANAVAMLKLAYRSEFPDERALFYGTSLAGLPDAAVEDAVRHIIDTSKFLPSVAEIKEAVAERSLNLPTPEEAWEIAERGRLREAAEPVRIAAEYVGGRWAIQTSDNIATVRSQFRKAYESARTQALRDFVSPRALPAGTANGAHELGPTMRALPETTRIRPRPVMARLSARWAGRDLAPPTDEEKADAIEVLRIDAGTTAWDDDGTETFVRDPLYLEAERIFAEGGETRDNDRAED